MNFIKAMLFGKERTESGFAGPPDTDWDGWSAWTGSRQKSNLSNVGFRGNGFDDFPSPPKEREFMKLLIELAIIVTGCLCAAPNWIGGRIEGWLDKKK
jgi:hypothetical protein